MALSIRERINAMIKFKFKVNNSFLQYRTRPITIPKTQVDYEQIKKDQLASDNVRVICPGNEHPSGAIYFGIAGYGPYYQVRINGSSRDPLRSLPFGARLSVLIEKIGSVVKVRLNKI